MDIQPLHSMKEFQDMIFISEILLQAKIANRASERLEATKTSFDKVEVWCSIQSILVAAGNVSKILWPVSKYKMRGERLRHFLNVGENNILSDRKFRNVFFEHYDERVEEWFQNQNGGVYIDLAMNPSLSGGLGGNEHRGYNSFDNSLMFRGERLDLNKVVNALSELHNICKLYVLDIV